MVEDAARRLLGLELGQRIERDGLDDSGLRVDYTYEECEPRVALEVTQITVPEDRQLISEAERKLEIELSTAAKTSSSGSWMVVLSRGAKAKELLPILKSLIAQRRPVRPNDYGSDDLLQMTREDAKAFVAEHRRLEHLGLQELTRAGGDPGEVYCVVMSGGEISGFMDRLDERIEAKRSTLRQAQGYDGHLAIVVDDIQASSVPDKTPLPSLPAEMSHLWVIHKWAHRSEPPEVWLARSGEREWLRTRWA